MWPSSLLASSLLLSLSHSLSSYLIRVPLLVSARLATHFTLHVAQSRPFHFYLTHNLLLPFSHFLSLTCSHSLTHAQPLPPPTSHLSASSPLHPSLCPATQPSLASCGWLSTRSLFCRSATCLTSSGGLCSPARCSPRATMHTGGLWSANTRASLPAHQGLLTGWMQAASTMWRPNVPCECGQRGCVMKNGEMCVQTGKCEMERAQ